LGGSVWGGRFYCGPTSLKTPFVNISLDNAWTVSDYFSLMHFFAEHVPAKFLNIGTTSIAKEGLLVRRCFLSIWDGLILVLQFLKHASTDLVIATIILILFVYFHMVPVTIPYVINHEYSVCKIITWNCLNNPVNPILLAGIDHLH